MGLEELRDEMNELLSRIVRLSAMGVPPDEISPLVERVCELRAEVVRLSYH